MERRSGQKVHGGVRQDHDHPDSSAGTQETEPCVQGRKGEPTPAELFQQPGEQAEDQRMAWRRGQARGPVQPRSESLLVLALVHAGGQPTGEGDRLGLVVLSPVLTGMSKILLGGDPLAWSWVVSLSSPGSRSPTVDEGLIRRASRSGCTELSGHLQYSSGTADRTTCQLGCAMTRHLLGRGTRRRHLVLIQRFWGRWA